MNKEKLQILVCCHKADAVIRNYPPYLPIQVGKSLHPELNLGFQNDNEGDNISERNPYWCELTAIYWGWKNLKNVEFSGLAHYRRYFDCCLENVENILSKYDIILAKVPSYDRQNNSRQLQRSVSQEDYWIYIDTLLSHHPEYKNAVLKYFYNDPDFIPFTMFIAKKELYDAFCEFVFSFFYDLEKRIKKHGYSRQNRCMAYFGEYSLGVFVTHQHLKPYCCDVVKIDDNVKKHSKVHRSIMKFGKHAIAYMTAFTKKEVSVPPAILVGLKQDGIELRAVKMLEDS